MARMRILITGITGFVGSHLTEWALSRGADVIGALRWRSNTEHIEHLRDRLTLIQSELRELSSARDLVVRARPDYIVHLAAQSFVGASWQTPAETLMTNAIGQMNLFEAIRQLGSASRFLVIGSSEEYGLVEPDELPIRETNPLPPLSPYAAGEVYNLCLGVDWTIERMLTFLISQSSVPGIEIRTDVARLRPSDVPVLRGSYEKIARAVGWRPRIPLEQTLTDLLDYWRQRIRRPVS